MGKSRSAATGSGAGRNSRKTHASEAPSGKTKALGAARTGPTGANGNANRTAKQHAAHGRADRPGPPPATPKEKRMARNAKILSESRERNAKKKAKVAARQAKAIAKKKASRRGK